MADVVDTAWLQRTILDLLLKASASSEPDHAACAKYADLLWKMLPRPMTEEETELSALRDEILNRS